MGGRGKAYIICLSLPLLFSIESKCWHLKVPALTLLPFIHSLIYAETSRHTCKLLYIHTAQSQSANSRSRFAPILHTQYSDVINGTTLVQFRRFPKQMYTHGTWKIYIMHVFTLSKTIFCDSCKILARFLHYLRHVQSHDRLVRSPLRQQ